MIALMYHDIVPADAPDASGFPGADAALYKVTPQQFDDQLAAIHRALIPAGISRHDLALTFDDGGASAVEAAARLEQYGCRGYFFVTADYVGAPGFLTAVALRELCARGHVVGSHSCSHPLRMAHCPPARIRAEWIVSRERLEQLLGHDVRMASVPGGDYSVRVAEAAADAGYTRLFTSEPTVVERRVAGLTVNGRYTIQRWMTARAVAGLASGAWLPRSRQVVTWTAKKIGKQLAGGGYLRARELVLGADDRVRWGDPG
jgi:peptidoglycan/xylan/chitin deacetylase (PgdA/CDA1 family)